MPGQGKDERVDPTAESHPPLMSIVMIVLAFGRK